MFGSLGVWVKSNRRASTGESIGQGTQSPADRIWGRTVQLLIAAAACGMAAAPAMANATESRLAFVGEYTLDLMHNAAGGLERGGGALHKARLAADADLGAGWSAHASAHYVAGAPFSGRYVGDLQGVDNIEADDVVAPFEVFLSRSTQDGRLTVGTGLIDLNRYFDVQSVGALFLHSSHGVGPDLSQTGVNGPSIFPTTGLAASLLWTPSKDWGFRLGAFDGAPGTLEDPRHPDLHLSTSEGALLIGEAERRFAGGLARGGVWTYTARYEEIARLGDPTPRSSRGSWGGYVLLEGALSPSGALKGWVRAGASNGKINAVNGYLGGGLVLDDAFVSGDQLGVAVARARFSQRARLASDLESAETAIELTYSLPLNDRVSIQPNLQFVFDPSGERHIENAVAIGVRFKSELEF